jgi:hypothetical protein
LNLDHSIQDEIKLDPDLSELFANLSWDKEIALCPAILEETEAEPINHKLTKLFEEGYADDPWWHKIRDEMCKTNGIPHSKELPLSECTITDNRLYFQDRLYVPATSKMKANSTNLRTLILQSAHDSVESGHPGKNKLFELIHRTYFWPRLSYDVKQFTRNCHSCMRNKTSRLKYQGTLKPLPIPL